MIKKIPVVTSLTNSQIKFFLASLLNKLPALILIKAVTHSLHI